MKHKAIPQMDRSVLSAPSVAGTLTPSVGVSVASGGGQKWPSQKEAKKKHEFFSKGSRPDFVLLGDLVEQRVHWVGSKGHKILCTAETGNCVSCQQCGESPDISDAQTEFVAPGMVLLKDRRYHQKILVFTEKMWEGTDDTQGLEELFAGSPARGHRFELRRHSSQKFTFVPAKSQPRSLALALPESFDVLPWVRARFNKPQDPARPAVWIEPFVLRNLNVGQGAKPKSLGLVASDSQPDPLEHKTDEERAAHIADLYVSGLKTLAMHVEEKYPVAAQLAQEIAEKKLGDLAMHALVSDPANYRPATLAGVGIEVEPLIDPPVTDGKLLTRASVETLAERRKKALADNTKSAREADAEKGTDRLTDCSKAMDDVLAMIAPSTNGTHPGTNGKGGAV